MGAALLQTPDLLCNILMKLVEEVGKVFEIGISVKIRILDKPEDTATLVKRLVATGITGLTVHCRTTPMRPRERAIRQQLKMIGEICREAGVACVMNGDVTSRKEALQLIHEFNVDGAMIATEAEKNPSCFRPDAEGGPHEWKSAWREVVTEYMRLALQVENRWGNTKYLLNQMIPGKNKFHADMTRSKNYQEVVKALDLQDTDNLLELAKEVDERLGLTTLESKAEKRARVKASKQQQQPIGKEKRKADDETDEPDAKRFRIPGPSAESLILPQDTVPAPTVSV